jgi:hypothetical protein
LQALHAGAAIIIDLPVLITAQIKTLSLLKQKNMSTDYKFLSDTEPTDEQLHILMLEVACEVKKKAQDANTLFLEQLQQTILQLKDKQVDIESV